jgi:hypothetical protein
MVVVGAAFTARAARGAAQALAQLPDVAPNAIARAPLGAVGRASDGKILVAVCIAEAAFEKVARIVNEFGGEIVSRYTFPKANRRGTPTAAPADLSRAASPGRPN